MMMDKRYACVLYAVLLALGALNLPPQLLSSMASMTMQKILTLYLLVASFILH
jgi:hypothetical protein